MDETVDQQIDKLQEAVRPLADAVLPIAAAVLAAIVAVYIVAKLLKRRKRKPPQPEPDLTIDVAALPATGPPATGPRLYCYTVPVRVAALVLAPAGRVRQLPQIGRLHDLLECIVPGLSEVIASHKPTIRRWPAQLSVRGFAHLFFSNAKLPGEGGKGTPWCSVAGVFKMEGQSVMAGMILRAEAATHFGPRVVEHEAQWLDVLRIKDATGL
jgi:hypothetical protein